MVTKKFKIYRFNQGVYAVRFDEQTSNPMDFVHMWNSHKGEQRVFAEQGQKLGSGNCGNVYQKTEDKAYKVISGKQKNIKINIENNFIILEQKFLLKEHGIEKYFILGLWTLKDNGNLIMPKVNRIYITKDKLKPMFDEFIFALKKLNELGYSHPDLAAELWHISPQNMLITSEGIRLIDIDPGLFHYQEFANSPVYADSRDKFIIDGQDQWIYVYNDMYARQESSGQRVRWRPELNKWYKEHINQSVSGNPEELLNLYKKGVLSLPMNLVNELHNSNASETIMEYHTGSEEKQNHSSYEVNTAEFSCTKYKKELQALQGAAQNREILNALKDSLEDVKTINELNDRKSHFYHSPEMKLIDKFHGTPHIYLPRMNFRFIPHQAIGNY
jgi:hypothetical protein